MLNTEQFTAANKAGIDALLGVTAKAYEGFEQLTALNMQVMKASLSEAAEASATISSAKDPQALLALQAGLSQPAAEKAAAYGRQVYEIINGTKAEIEKLANEQAAGVKSSLLGVIEAASKNAPEGSASGVAMFKQAMAAANNAFDGMQKAGRQVAEAAEANFSAVSATVTKASKAKRS